MDERDKRIVKTPPRGVRLQTADPDPFDEEDTPALPEDPLDEMRRRQKSTNRKIDRLQNTMVGFVDRDTREHSEMREAMTDHASTTSQKIETVREDVGRLEVCQAEVNGKLTILIDEVKSQRRITETHRRVTIEEESRRSLLRDEDAADAKKIKRGLWAKITGLLIAGVASIFGVLGIAQC